MIKVFVADDQMLFKSMLISIIDNDPELELVGSASDGQEAIKKIKELKPDICVLDIQMPKASGVDVLNELKNSNLNSKVILLTTFEDANNIVEARSANVDSYLLKDMKPEILLMAIKCVHANLRIFNSDVFEMISPQNAFDLEPKDNKVTIGDLLFDQVEIEIIKQIAEGRTNKEIAKNLNYSEGTIKNKISNILSNTGLPDRVKISIFAIKNNII